MTWAWADFTSSIHCHANNPAANHCNACRTDAAFRESIDATERVFNCPIGYAIGQKVTIVQVEGGRVRTSPKCRKPACS